MHVYWKYLGTMGTYTKYNITRYISTVYTTPLTQTPIWNELIPIVNSAIIQSGLWYPPVDLGWNWVARSEKRVYKQLAWFVRSRPQTPPSHKDKQSGEPSWIFWASADFVTESPRNILCQTCSKRYRYSSRDKKIYCCKGSAGSGNKYRSRNHISPYHFWGNKPKKFNFVHQTSYHREAHKSWHETRLFAARGSYQYEWITH